MFKATLKQKEDNNLLVDKSGKPQVYNGIAEEKNADIIEEQNVLNASITFLTNNLQIIETDKCKQIEEIEMQPLKSVQNEVNENEQLPDITKEPPVLNAAVTFLTNELQKIEAEMEKEPFKSIENRANTNEQHPDEIEEPAAVITFLINELQKIDAENEKEPLKSVENQANENKQHPDDIGEPDDLIELGSNNTTVKREILQKIDWTDASSATKTLLSAKFKSETLANSSMTALSSSDENILNDIFNYVRIRFNLKDCYIIKAEIINHFSPGINSRYLKGAFTTKSAEKSKIKRHLTENNTFNSNNPGPRPPVKQKLGL